VERGKIVRKWSEKVFFIANRKTFFLGGHFVKRKKKYLNICEWGSEQARKWINSMSCRIDRQYI
jgi:hypothetical protein